MGGGGSEEPSKSLTYFEIDTYARCISNVNISIVLRINVEIHNAIWLIIKLAANMILCWIFRVPITEHNMFCDSDQLDVSRKGYLKLGNSVWSWRKCWMNFSFLDHYLSGKIRACFVFGSILSTFINKISFAM